MTTPGRFGDFGGRYVPEALIPALEQLDEVRRKAMIDPEFIGELERLHRTYTGRPSIITEVPRFAEHAGGARIILKREDLNHTGSHKINNVLGQALLTKRMGKSRVIAETGAGQHGVATATAAALLGLDCVVYMGKVDTERQALNVARMRLLGAEVVAVTNGSQTLKDAVNEALRDWVANVEGTHYVLGTVTGPHPFPEMVRDFHRVIGVEARAQVLDSSADCPTSSSPASAAAPTRWASSTASSTTRESASSASRPAAPASPRADTRPGSPPASGASSTGRSPTSCRTSTVRRSSPTPSRPVSTTPASAPSTPTCSTSGARNTVRSPTSRPWRRSSCSAAPRASSPRSSPPTPRGAIDVGRELGPEAVLLVNLSGRGDKDVHTAAQWFGLLDDAALADAGAVTALSDGIQA